MNKAKNIKELNKAYEHLENVYALLEGESEEISESIRTCLDMIDDLKTQIALYEQPEKEYDPFEMADRYNDEKALED